MKDTEVVKKEEKFKELPKSRVDRRLEKRKKEILNKLVLDFFTQRSAISDPEGEGVAKLFDKYRDLWFSECRNFNMHRTPFKLRYEAFAEGVEFYLKMEKDQMAKSVEANKLKDFDHWFRRAHVWRTRPLNSLYYWCLSLGRHEKYLNHWKNYYKSL